MTGLSKPTATTLFFVAFLGYASLITQQRRLKAHLRYADDARRLSQLLQLAVVTLWVTNGIMRLAHLVVLERFTVRQRTRTGLAWCVPPYLPCRRTWLRSR